MKEPCSAALSRFHNGHIHRCRLDYHWGSPTHYCSCGHQFSDYDIVHELDD